MFKVTKEIHFCYGHRLLNYEGKCRFLHGHNAKVEIELVAESLDTKGMVVDFHEIARIVQSWIDETIDHKMLLHKQDPAVSHLKSLGEPMILLETNPTAETIAKMIFDHAQSKKLPVTEVRLWETPTSFATYRQA